MRLNLHLIIMFSTFLFSHSVLASGGGGFDQSGFSKRKIDQQYELGKSYYKSPQADGTRLEYCVKNGESFKKLSRKSVKPFKKGVTSKFVASLYSCADSSVLISDTVDPEQGDAILYYLNKRFKLRLKQG
ncbi:MAG: hypothetical protein KTR32_19650 [Granulosicoccus sp.]|nr:hypothetical protein [Granulosicoccus sp.]